MTKIYRTKHLTTLYIPLTLPSGKKVDVLFSGGVNMDMGAVYGTSDKEIQAILDERCKRAGCPFFLEKAIEDAEEVKETAKVDAPKEEDITPVDILDSREFNNLVELRNALKEKGIDVTGLTTVQRAETLAKKNGYLYTIKKN